MSSAPRLLARLWSAHSSGALLEYAAGGEQESCPSVLAPPWSTHCSGPLLEYACGGERSPALVPCPPTTSGPLLNTPALTMSLTSKCPEAKAIELGLTLGA